MTPNGALFPAADPGQVCRVLAAKGTMGLPKPRLCRSAGVALALLAALASCGAPHSRAPQRGRAVHARPRPPPAPSAAERQQCLAGLTAASATFQPLPDQYFGAGCSTVNTVRLLSVNSDTAMLGLSNLGPVACPLANTFAAWARYGVDRAARQILGSPLVRIETMGSYSCRNVAGTDRMSAHALAQAIDVSAFVLADGRRISVLGNWSAGTDDERAFLRTVHQSACKRFGTVLGPDYNTAHRNHLHLEYTGGRFCR